jgi:hypothetical protein
LAVAAAAAAGALLAEAAEAAAVAAAALRTAARPEPEAFTGLALAWLPAALAPALTSVAALRVEVEKAGAALALALTALPRGEARAGEAEEVVERVGRVVEADDACGGACMGALGVVGLASS